MPPKYLFKRGMPALYSEIYLPKKSGFQGALYAALTQGRDPRIIHEHLTKHRTRIQEILQRDWPTLRNRLTRKFIAELSADIGKLFTGYSMYEVDGVYFAPGDLEPSEVRTQVIRLIFECPIDDDAPDDLVREIKLFLAAPSSSLSDYEPSDPVFVSELKRVETWVERVGVFMFGFILHRIEQAIDENPDLKQDEIWVTSFWEAIINKFVPDSKT